jgi:diguanylate cyclase (GGDEF)-like protein
MKLLLVEDDQAFASSIQQLLETHYYSVDSAADGYMAQEMTEVFSYDLILLDWMLPRKTGIEVCRALREAGDRTPIILMTARDSATDEVAGLDAGADDYLVKPFGFEELLAHIRAVLRRSEGIASPVLAWGDLRLDPSSAEVSCCLPNGESKPIPVTPKEYGLLEVFLRNPNRIFSMDALIDKVWPFDDAPTTGAIRTHIKGLRQKTRAVGLAEVIDTVYGLGYRLCPAIAVVVDDSKLKKPPAKKTAAASNAAAPVDLSALWQPVKSTYLQRVETLSKAINNLPAGTPNQHERESITTEAHALAGSLGSFGFATITPECRQIERIFREHETLSSKQLQALRVAIDKVQQTLDTSEPTLTPSPAFVDHLSVGPADNFIESAKDKAKAAKVLIVDDDPAILTLLEGLLQGWGFRLQLLSDSQQFWETMEQFDPDIVLLDVEMPQVSGFDLCQQLRDQPRWSELPVLCLSAHTEAEVIQRVFSIGADDYIRKPIIAAELIARVVSWLERARDRKLKAEVDPLTGVSNRQKSTQEMTRLLGLAKRYEQPFCLAVIDIDQFKRINDRFDHAVGDRILRRLGACLRSAFRAEDVIGRWGGEEFVVGLYGVAAEEGKQYIDRLLADWQRIQTANGTTEPTVTFTTGLATYPTDIDPDGDLQSLHQAADKALQTAKVRSRQRILAEVG